MITPKFILDQDDNFLHLEIHCPFMRGKEMEFVINDCEFRFSGSPYFLRLRFSQELIEDGTEKCTWNVNEGIVAVSLPKKNKGEKFSDLDMLSKLLFTKKQFQDHAESAAKPGKGPLIQEISSTSTPDDEEQDFDWELEQNIPSENLLNQNYYGFDLAYSGVFQHFDEGFQREIFGFCPESSTLSQRKAARVEKEIEKFSIDDYLYDLVDEEGNISSLLGNPLWTSTEYSDRERQELTNLKIKEKCNFLFFTDFYLFY
jgi:protein SHQ1